MEYQGQEYSKLITWFSENWGRNVNFSNGCSVWLHDDGGFIWRTDPYGQDGGCNYTEGWENNIRKWLEYWDEPRTETGELMSE